MDCKRLLSLFLLLFGFNLWGFSGTEKGIQALPEEFQEEASTILQKYQELQKLKPVERRLNLDLDDGAVTSVFTKPGFFSTEECEADAAKQTKKNKAKGCASIGWPDSKSVITSTGNIEFRVEEDAEGNETLRTYAEIEFAYTRDGSEKKGKGWISQDLIAFDPVSPSYSEIAYKKATEVQTWLKEKWEKICPPAKTAPQILTPPAQNNIGQIAELTNALEKQVADTNQKRRTVAGIATELSGSIGKCMLKPPDKAPQKFSGSLVYDQFVLPSMKKTALPKDIKKENGQPLSQKDLIDIDALARTLYAEMASCTSIGAQYPMAVARVIMNREQAMQANPNFIQEFVKNNNEHDSSKSLLCRAATSPVLFSAWNQKIIDFKQLKEARSAEVKSLHKRGIKGGEAEKKARQSIQPDPDSGAYYKPNESGLLHTLCPPSDPKDLCYTGKVPDKNSAIAWENTIRIAVEAVLFPKQFSTKTAELEGIKHYTSDRDKFYDFIQVKPSIEGRKITSDRCLNLWRPMTEAEKKAKAEAEKRKAAKGKSGIKSKAKKKK